MRAVGARRAAPVGPVAFAGLTGRRLGPYTQEAQHFATIVVAYRLYDDGRSSDQCRAQAADKHKAASASLRWRQLFSTSS